MFRWHSTPESSDAGEPSALAIVETLAAVSISFWIAWRWGTVQHIAIGACVAPLLLLRTEESQELALRWVEKWGNPLMGQIDDVFDRGSVGALLSGLAFLLTCPLLVVLVKVAATLAMGVRYPVQTFRAIPLNWKRVALALDVKTPPEPLPGVYRLDEERLDRIGIGTALHFGKFRERIAEDVREARRGEITAKYAIVAVALVFGLPLIYIPALAYRWSLKASSLIYAPLLYVVDESRKDEENPEARLKYNGRSAFARLLAVYSIGVVFAFCATWYLLVHWNGFAAWWNGSPFWLTLGTLVEPRFFTKWQVAQAINAALALGVFLYAWHVLQRSDSGFKPDLVSANRNLSILFAVRAVLTVYVLFCTIYLTINGWQGFKGPPIDKGHFPSW